MLISIYRERTTCLATFRIHDVCEIKLQPGVVYWLYLYAESGESWPEHPQPRERGDVVVIKRSSAHEQQADSTCPPGMQVLQRVQFKVDNDLPIPKIIRWAFAWEHEREYQTFRISLRVQPRVIVQWYVLVSLVGVLFLSELFNTVVSAGTGGISLACCGQRLLTALGVSVALLALGALLIQVLGFLFAPED